MFHSSEVPVCDLSCWLNSRTVSLAAYDGLGAADAKKIAHTSVETMISKVKTVKTTSLYRKSAPKARKIFEILANNTIIMT